MQKAKMVNKRINTFLSMKLKQKEMKYLYNMTSSVNSRLIFKATIIEISHCESPSAS